MANVLWQPISLPLPRVLWPSTAAASQEKRLSLLCTARPHLEHCVQVCVPQYKKDIKLLESVHRGIMKMVKNPEGKMHEELLRTHALLSSEQSRLRGGMAAYNF